MRAGGEMQSSSSHAVRVDRVVQEHHCGCDKSKVVLKRAWVESEVCRHTPTACRWSEAMTAQGPAEAASAEPAAWLRLQPEWQCTAEDVFRIPEHFLAPTWRMMVLGDGSPTRHLHLLSG